MANWVQRLAARLGGRGRRRVAAPHIRSRSDLASESTRVDLHELAPELSTFLGKAAYVQLMIFENLSRVVSTAPTTAAKARLGEASALTIERYRALSDEIERLGQEPGAAMEPFVREIDDFQRRTRGNDWWESVAACYLCGGFLTDFFGALATGLDETMAVRLEPVFAPDAAGGILSDLLLEAIEPNPRLAARLAMWGRRLVGDTMLVARSTLRSTSDPDTDEERIEPVFSELIAAHTRRMDALGLTA